MKIIIFLISLILIFLLFILVLKKNKESFENSCSNFFNKNSFCELNVENNKCTCKLQKDDLRYNFSSPEICCKNNCEELKPEECVENNNFTRVPYYCNIGGVCKKYEGTIVSDHISANYCGTDPLNNQILLPYSSIKECSKSIDYCDKYNNPFNTKHVNKTNCLKDSNCGYCTNSLGGGKCISGNATEPNDLQKYYYCNNYSRDSGNNYEYGNQSAYLLQKPTPLS